MVKFAWGRYKLFLCLVSNLWFSLLVKKKILFCTTNISKDRIYCDAKGKICNFLNKFLHETLFPQPSIILIALTIDFSRYNQSSNLERTILIPHKWCSLQHNNDTIRYHILNSVHLFCCTPFYISVCVCVCMCRCGGGGNCSLKWTLFYWQGLPSPAEYGALMNCQLVAYKNGKCVEKSLPQYYCIS